MRRHYAKCLLLFGRNDEAVDQIKRTLELEPLSISYNFEAGRIYYFLGRYPQAIEQLKNTLDLAPGSLAAHDVLGLVYEKMGDEKSAIVEWSAVLSLSGKEELANRFKSTFERSGLAAANRLRVEDQLKELDESVRRGEYVAASEYATAHMRKGDKDAAFAWLAKAAQERNRFAVEFKINPLYDSVRSDTRFQQLIDSVKVVD